MSRLERLLSRRAMKGAKVEVLTDAFAVILHPAGTVIRLDDPQAPDQFECSCLDYKGGAHKHGSCGNARVSRGCDCPRKRHPFNLFSEAQPFAFRSH